MASTYSFSIKDTEAATFGTTGVFTGTLTASFETSFSATYTITKTEEQAWTQTSSTTKTTTSTYAITVPPGQTGYVQVTGASPPQSLTIPTTATAKYTYGTFDGDVREIDRDGVTVLITNFNANDLFTSFTNLYTTP